MKIVLAFDSFKGSLTAPDACSIVAAALTAESPALHVVIKPMADGGEGTAQAVMAACGGQWVAVPVMGPLHHMELNAGFVWFKEASRALVEMAAASGLTHLCLAERQPLLTTTYGTGQLIRAALDNGARHVWLAVGGSATVDGGVGAAMALGWRFLDERGESVGLGGGELERIRRIVPPPRRVWPPVEVLCDVDNPLCGEHGAARVFGPQKGATPAMVERLDAGLRHLGELVKAQLGVDVLNVPGAGAAGGLAAGAMAFLNARLVSGIDTIMQLSGLEPALAGVDWVITGEGAFDSQSLRGKVVSGVVRLARQAGVPVALIAGSIGVPPETYRSVGVAAAFALRAPGMSLDESIAQAPRLLAERAREFLRAHLKSQASAGEV